MQAPVEDHHLGQSGRVSMLVYDCLFTMTNLLIVYYYSLIQTTTFGSLIFTLESADLAEDRRGTSWIIRIRGVFKSYGRQRRKDIAQFVKTR